MRCSSSEALLDEYVEGLLKPRKAQQVAAHVAHCPDCARLLEELRVIDALLLTPRQVELAPNFTYKAMAEIRALPPPHAHNPRPFAVLGTYLVVAWLAIGAFFFFGGATAQAAYSVAQGSLNFYFDSAEHLTSATSHLLGPNTTSLTEAASAIFIGDVLFASAVAGFYAYLRSRGRKSREAC